jgi:hypothetical protein
MKNKIILLLLFNFWLLYYSHSQPYKSVFGKDTTQWNVTYLIPDAMPTYIYKTFGDTIISEKSYRPLYKGYRYYSGNNYGYLREDTITGKLWFLSASTKQERLIMDLSLNENDTFVFKYNVKYNVDDIYYQKGRKYISFVGNSKDSILFIEGIGPSCFLFEEEVAFPDRAQIRCMFKDYELIYHNEAYVNCIDTVTSIHEKLIQNFLIYPNPTSSNITIKLDKQFPYKIEFYSSNGLKISEHIVYNNEPINLSHMPSGLYFIKIIMKSEILLSKFLKL